MLHAPSRPYIGQYLLIFLDFCLHLKVFCLVKAFVQVFHHNNFYLNPKLVGRLYESSISISSGTPVGPLPFEYVIIF